MKTSNLVFRSRPHDLHFLFIEKKNVFSVIKKKYKKNQVDFYYCSTDVFPNVFG